jgi:hypothetical protein
MTLIAKEVIFVMHTVHRGGGGGGGTGGGGRG